MRRTLIYIPIVHTDPDLGSLSSDVEEKASELLGKRWQEHKKTVKQYWQEIFKYFEGRDLKKVKIFQDSLPVGGEAARTMIEKLAQTGSPNYQLLKDLNKKGAQLLKTEDLALLKKEYRLTRNLMAKKNIFLAILAFLEYKLKKNKLLEARDKYIAKRINQGLKEGETGICFLGAYHQILSKLANNIRIVSFKAPEKVRKYYQALSRGEKTGKIEELASYLIKPEK